MDAQHFQPHADRTGWLTAYSAETLGLWQPAFGLWLSYARDPVVFFVDGEPRTRMVGDLLTADLQVALGFGPADLALDLPIHLAISGEEFPAWGAAPKGASVGDLRLIPKIRIANPDERPLGVALVVPVSLPTGDQESFGGLRTATIAPTLAVSGRAGRFHLGANVGYRIAGYEQVDDLVVGNSFLFRAAVSYSPHPVVDVGAEIFGDVHSQPRNNPVEWLVCATVHPVPGLGLTLGGGTALGRGFGAPEGRLLFGVGYAPRLVADTDGDGIRDARDGCPDLPEDIDGFQDRDGCPDPDNDADGILDADDGCPDAPEIFNNAEDGDGCPDRGRVMLQSTEIIILDKVYFDTNKAVIKEKSYPLLDDVAALLNRFPGIRKVEIQGHTDERGDDSYNLRLSEARALAVRAYLAGAGVDADRLDARGYGETQPLEAASNEQAWDRNRRVQFVIVEQE